VQLFSCKLEDGALLQKHTIEASHTPDKCT